MQNREIQTYYRLNTEVTLPYSLKTMAYSVPVPSVYVLQFTSPQNLNPMTFTWVGEMFFCLEYFERLPECKVLIFTGSGRAFSAGADATMLEVLAKGEHNIKPQDYLVHLGQDVFDRLKGYDHFNKGQVGFPDISLIGLTKRLLNFRKISCAAVNGFAVGGAANIALFLTDFCFCSKTSFFMYPFADRGVPPELGSSLLLPLAVGVSRAKHWFMTGEKLTSSVAVELGLVKAAFEDDKLIEGVVAFAKQFADAKNYPGRVLAKLSVNETLLKMLETTETLDRENKSFLASTSSEYFKKVTKLLLHSIKPKI